MAQRRKDAGRRAWGIAAAFLIAALAAGLARPALALGGCALPGLFDVIGIAPGGTLPLRAAPTPDAAVIATHPAEARALEVVESDPTGHWARLNAAERSGWAPLAHLRCAREIWGDEGLPDSLICLGTEPFWSLRPRDGALVYAAPDSAPRRVPLTQVLTSGLGPEARRALLAADPAAARPDGGRARGGGWQITAVMLAKACVDGMSDRAYGLDITLILAQGAAPRLLRGCCSVQPR